MQGQRTFDYWFARATSLLQKSLQALYGGGVCVDFTIVEIYFVRFIDWIRIRDFGLAKRRIPALIVFDMNHFMLNDARSNAKQCHQGHPGKDVRNKSAIAVADNSRARSVIFVDRHIVY